MNRLRSTSLLLLAALTIACDEPLVTQPSAATSYDASLAPNEGHACYPVEFAAVSGFGQPPFDIEGEMRGDLNGTFGGNFDLSSLEFAGRVNRIAGTITMTVTSGSLPISYPWVFTIEFVQLSHQKDTAVSPATVSEMSGRARGTAGVTRANLTYHGFFDATVPVAQHVFRGVICP